MLAKILFVGVQHGTDNFGQELFHLLRGAAGEIFGAQLGLDLLAGQTECRVSFHAGNHIIGLALLLDHSGSGHGVMFSLAMNGSSAITRLRTTLG